MTSPSASGSNEAAGSRSLENVNPKPYAGSNMVGAINNLLTQRLSNAQKFGPAVIGMMVKNIISDTPYLVGKIAEKQSVGVYF